MQKAHQSQDIAPLFGLTLRTKQLNQEKQKTLTGAAAIVVAFFIVILTSLTFNLLSKRLETRSGFAPAKKNEMELAAFLPSRAVTKKIALGYFSQ